MKAIHLFILILLPTLGFGQEQDSFRKTDVVKSRFNVEVLGTFAAIKSDLVADNKLETSGKLSETALGGIFGISQDFRIRKQSWINLGIYIGNYRYKRLGEPRYRNEIWTIDFQQMAYSLSYVRDIQKSNTPFYIGTGIKYNHLTQYNNNISGPNLDSTNNTIIRYYSLTKDLYSCNLKVGKLINIDQDLNLRLEGYFDYGLNSAINKPNRGTQYVLGFKIGLSTFFHKWEKVE